MVSEHAPKPIGPYSQALLVREARNIIFVSGQIPIDPSTGKLVEGDFKKQVEVVLKNIESILRECGANLRNVVKVTVYLTDISKYEEFNEVYMKYFSKPYPARTLIEVSRLPRNSPIEIEVIAVV